MSPPPTRRNTRKVREGEIRFLGADRVGVDAESESGVSVAEHVGDPPDAPSRLQRQGRPRVARAVLTAFPNGVNITGGVGYVTISATRFNGFVSSTHFIGETGAYFTIYASLPTLSSLGTFSLSLSGDTDEFNTIYLETSWGVSGNEVERTFIPEPNSGLLLALGLMALPAAAGAARRRPSRQARDKPL